jgi:rod shape-determining protein MreC
LPDGHLLLTPVQVENGVQILTSGQDGIYPRGLPTGRLSNPPELVGSTQQRLVVEPAANLGRLEMVLVLQIPPEKIRAKIDDVAEEERRLETESLRKR